MRAIDLGEHIVLGHGSGGLLTAALIDGVFRPAFANATLDALGDAAVVGDVGGPLALTTDGFVVQPLRFPGGDIGTLAVCGTVNDLAVAGARPLWLTASFVLEEGLAVALLRDVVRSMGAAAREAGVTIVAGDTKVVERGRGDGMHIVTAGAGRMLDLAPEGASAVEAGDVILVSGPVGDHGATIAAVRSGLDPGGLVSDCGHVTDLVAALRAAGVRPRFLRDPTRGGLATVLAEVGRAAGLTASLREADIPIRPSVRAVCDILGLEALHLACEGRVVAVVPARDASAALTAWRSHSLGSGAAIIGRMVPREAAPIVVETRAGGHRLHDALAGEPLPRIC